MSDVIDAQARTAALARAESYATAPQPARRKAAWPFATPLRADNAPPHSWLAEVHRARSMASPDAPAAMATVLGAASALQGLRGTLLDGCMTDWHGLDDARSALKAKLRLAWSTEALERGVQLARSGDLDAAMPLYQQALQLDPTNADAMVAQGAAMANVRQYQDAVDMLLHALALQPHHANALKYMQAVKTKAAAAGVMLRCQPPPTAGASQPNDARPSTAGQPGQHSNDAATVSSDLTTSSSSGGGRRGGGGGGVQGPMDLGKALDIVSRHAKRDRSKSKKRKRQKEKGDTRHKNKHKKSKKHKR